MAKQDDTQSPIIGVEQPSNAIKGGYQEVSPSPPSDPDPPDSWGTAIPSNTTPVANQSNADETSKSSTDK